MGGDILGLSWIKCLGWTCSVKLKKKIKKKLTVAISLPKYFRQQDYHKCQKTIFRDSVGTLVGPRKEEEIEDL